jgi:flagellar biosynthesis protein FlhF
MGKTINSIREKKNDKYEKDDFGLNLSEDLRVLYNYLKQQGLKPELIQNIVAEIKQKPLDNIDDIFKVVKQILTNIIENPEPIKLNKKRKIVAFVGPTGVGKTTTIAKLAAKFALEHEKKVGLITSDTYRIAAVEQLKTYSDIVNISLQVLYNDNELEDIIENNYSKHELILLDTAGTSWNDKIQIGRLKKITNHDLIDEIHLLIGLNTKSKDLISIIENFSELKPDKLILSKFDETKIYGDIINIKNKYNLPVG